MLKPAPLPAAPACGLLGDRSAFFRLRRIDADRFAGSLTWCASLSCSRSSPSPLVLPYSEGAGPSVENERTDGAGECPPLALPVSEALSDDAFKLCPLCHA